MSLLRDSRPQSGLKRFLSLRNTIKILALFLAVGIYYLYFEQWAYTDNLFSQLKSEATYNFYSGSRGGFYIRIGNYLDSVSNAGEKIKVKNNTTGGSVENWNSVVTKTNAFALVNELTAPENNDNRAKANYVTPVYMERLHIFYRKEAYKGILGEVKHSKDLDDQKPILSANLDKVMKNFLSKAEIYGGSYGSGTRLIASYLLTTIKLENPDFDYPPLIENNNEDGVKEFLAGKTDIHFAIMGDPILWMDKLLRDSTNFGLISIDPVLINKVNTIYGLNLQLAYFKDKYKEVAEIGEITTLGSYVNLLASNDVPKSAIRQLLAYMDAAVPEHFFPDKDGTLTLFNNHVQNDTIINAKNFQLDEVEFEYVRQRLKNEMTTVFQSCVLFLIIVSSIALAIYWVIIKFISRSRTSRYDRIINEIYQVQISPKFQLANRTNNMVTPIVGQKASGRIRSLCQAYQKIHNVINKAYSDYRSRKIEDSDYKVLLRDFQIITENFKMALYRQLYHAIQNDEPIDTKSLQDFFVAGFMQNRDYEQLLALRENRDNITNFSLQ